MALRTHRILSALAGVAVAAVITGCGSESPDTPTTVPTAAATAPRTSAMGVSEQDSSIDLVDAHLTPASGHRTLVQATLANTDPVRRHDLMKVTAKGARAHITGPGTGDSPGRLPLPAATHVDTLASQYTITLPLRPPAQHQSVPVTFTFAGTPRVTLALPVLPR